MTRTTWLSTLLIAVIVSIAGCPEVDRLEPTAPSDSVSVAGQSDYSGASRVEAPAGSLEAEPLAAAVRGGLPAPSDLEAFEEYDDGITLAWLSEVERGQIEVQQRSADRDWHTIETVDAHIDTLRVDGLELGVEYRYRVRSRDGETFSAWSDVVGARLDRDTSPPVPPVPTDLRILGASLGSIHLGWTLAPGVASTIRIQFARGSGEWFQLARIDGELTEFFANGLEGEAEYRFRLRAEDSSGVSAWSDAVVGVPGSGPPAVLNYEPVAVRARLITIRPTNVSPNTDTIEVLWGVNGSGQSQTATFAWPHDGNIRLENLTPDSDYNIYIRAHNDFGSSEWWWVGYSLHTTGAPAIPNYEPVAVRAQLITIRPTNVSPNTDTIEVLCGVNGSGQSQTATFAWPHDGNIRLENLTPDSDYNIYIRAHNDFGTSEWWWVGYSLHTTGAPAIPNYEPVAVRARLITIRPTNVSQNTDSIEVLWGINGSGQSQTATYAWPHDGVIRLEDLTPDSDYNIFIRAHNDFGISEWWWVGYSLHTPP